MKRTWQAPTIRTLFVTETAQAGGAAGVNEQGHINTPIMVPTPLGSDTFANSRAAPAGVGPGPGS